MKWYTTVYKGFIISAIIAYVIGFLSPSVKICVGAYISGHVMCILGVMMILLHLLTVLLSASTAGTMKDISYKLFLYGGPFILLLVNISIILYLMLKYSKNIVDGHVSSSYNSFSNIACALVIAQTWIIYSNVSSDSFQKQGSLSKVLLSSLFLLGVLFAMNTVVIYTILKYFITDGFV